MSVTRIASRYAKSLIDLAVEQGKLERIVNDINYFVEAVKNRDFYLLLKSPIINVSKKGQIFKSLFSEHFDDLTMAFLRIILNKKREAFLPDIANDFIAQYKTIKKISSVKVTTAVPMGENALKQIKAKLEASSATRENVEIETAVDPDIIGGFVIEFEDKLYDASVAHKLEQLRKELSKNDYVKDF